MSGTSEIAAGKGVCGVPVVQFGSVVVLIGGFPALAGADVTIDAGEVVLIQGPNGAGKTTLLRLCAGLIAPSSGSAHVLGIDLGSAEGRRRVRRTVGLMGHTTALYDDLTVSQNLDFWAATNRAEPATVAMAMERAGVSGRLASVKVASLSAGQRRRTAIAVLLCRRPNLWLLDEPHAGLDAAGRQLVNELVADASAAGATVVIASHDQEWAAPIATRTLSVVGGQVHS